MISDASSIHVSVLLEETVNAVEPRSGGFYIDATCGLGGHTEALLEACSPDGRVLSVDRDPRALDFASRRAGETPTPHGKRKGISPHQRHFDWGIFVCRES